MSLGLIPVSAAPISAVDAVSAAITGTATWAVPAHQFAATGTVTNPAITGIANWAAASPEFSASGEVTWPLRVGSPARLDTHGYTWAEIGTTPESPARIDTTGRSAAEIN